VLRAGEVVVDRARRLAADMLEAAEADVVLVDGRIGVSGVPSRSFSWAELAAHAAEPSGVELLGKDGLFAEDDFDQPQGTYPFGAHLAVVEVDTETGKARLLRLVAIDDCGKVLNPMIVTGQVHGGLLQGIAQALYEEMSVDDAGNPQGTTLAEYGIPSAAEVPSFEVGQTVTASPRNPLGMKGIGESGSVGATPAVQNAVLDALAPYGITHLDMPLTSLKIWEALQSSSGIGLKGQPV